LGDLGGFPFREAMPTNLVDHLVIDRIIRVWESNDEQSIYLGIKGVRDKWKASVEQIPDPDWQTLLNIESKSLWFFVMMVKLWTIAVAAIEASGSFNFRVFLIWIVCSLP
jgi:hypothetical protein